MQWRCETSSRRTIFMKYSPHGTSWSSQYYDETEYDVYPDMTDRMRAILKPPSAHTWAPRGGRRGPAAAAPPKDGIG
eukprot:SAG22_NODE_17173_length_310_cov_0.781991_1_plen_76_part_10